MTTRRLLAIASVERTGSTLLCSILRATKAAGNPVEYLNIQTNNFATFRERHHTPRIKASFLPMALARKATGRFPWRDISSFSRTSFIDYLHEIAEVNTTSNGVFGVKMHWNQYKRHMLDLGVDVSVWGAPVSWLRITRENELRQAISFVRAAQTESWNSNMAVTKEPRYDADAIIAALDRIASENHDWDRYFAEHSITPRRARGRRPAADHQVAVGCTQCGVGRALRFGTPRTRSPSLDSTHQLTGTCGVSRGKSPATMDAWHVPYPRSSMHPSGMRLRAFPSRTSLTTAPRVMAPCASRSTDQRCATHFARQRWTSCIARSTTHVSRRTSVACCSPAMALPRKMVDGRSVVAAISASVARTATSTPRVRPHRRSTRHAVDVSTSSRCSD